MTTELKQVDKEDRDARILELARTGMTQRKIAEAVNVTQPSVASVLKRVGFVYGEDDKRKKNRAGNKKRELSAEDELIEPKQPVRIDIVQKQYKNGMQLDQLARLYEVDVETLNPIVAGIEQKARKKSIEDEKVAEQIRELAEEEELTKYVIVQVLGLSLRKVERIARDFGITFPSATRGTGDELETTEQPPTKRGRGRRRDLSDDEMASLAQAIRTLAAKDLSISAISRELGHSYARVNRIVKEHSIPITKSKNDPTRLTADGWQERLDAIQAMANEGKSTKDICAALDITSTYLLRICRKHGIKGISKKGRPKKPTTQQLPDEPKEGPAMPEQTTASLESAVTAFKAEEIPELIGALDEHMERNNRIERRVLNRDKAVWGDYLSARSEEIENVTHQVDVVVENGKLIERTVIQYTLERELGR